MSRPRAVCDRPTHLEPTFGRWSEGAVPLRLTESVTHGPLLEVSQSEALLRLPTVGRFLARAGLPPVVDRLPGVNDDDVRCFVRGPVAALGALLAGRFPLRASAVAIGGVAVVLAGPSAAGKSTVTAALATRGHQVLADGVVVIEEEPPVVLTSRPAVDLWPDAAKNLGFDPAGGQVVRAGLAKRSYRFPGITETARVPLGAVVMLAQDGRLGGTGPTIETQPLGRAEGLARMVSCEWYPELVGPLGLAVDHLGWAATTASECQVTDVVRAKRTPTSDIAELTTLVEALVR